MSFIEAGAETPEARFARETIRSLRPDQVSALQVQLQRMGVYVHGTGTGSIAKAGNPAARLMDGRYTYRVGQVPPPIDEKEGAARARYFQQAVAYFKANGARVVNMSFRLTEPQVEASLASVEPDPEARQKRARAIFDTMHQALEEAIRKAPDILFVAGAGNENESVAAARSIPAGFDLPNLLTVGAVDRALRPTSFSSYGGSGDVYANGHLVTQDAPGGMTLISSGTSSAAPFVTNLAGKLLALRPSLSAAELRRMIERSATPEGPQRLRVINPQAAIQQLRRVRRTS